jgi:hypothetical protein
MAQHGKQLVTVALSHHRPEIVRPAALLMSAHAAIFLEEPPSQELTGLLAGKLPVTEYVNTIDTEYPEFSRRMAIELSKLHAEGRQIFAVEPFMERLLGIHELFAAGGSPADLEAQTDRYFVYLAERDATAALLGFYESAATGSFQKTIAAVKAFARQDARRFVLRDKMRAASLTRAVQPFQTAYVEAGQMHYALWRYLRRSLGSGFDVRLRFVMTPPQREGLRAQRLYGPGDTLTLLYIFHPGIRDAREDLLAARSLIYHKLVVKTEISAADSHTPHAENEAAVLARLNRLSVADCRHLYPLVRQTATERAIAVVDHYLKHH